MKKLILLFTIMSILPTLGREETLSVVEKPYRGGLGNVSDLPTLTIGEKEYDNVFTRTVGSVWYSALCAKKIAEGCKNRNFKDVKLGLLLSHVCLVNGLVELVSCSFKDIAQDAAQNGMGQETIMNALGLW